MSLIRPTDSELAELLRHNLSQVPTGVLIRLLAYCVHQEEAALASGRTREFADRAEAELNSRIPLV